MPNEIDCYNNQTLFLFVLQQTHFDWMGLNCCIFTNCYVR